MAIYKSSFNKKPDKKEKDVKDELEEKQPKPKKNFKLNGNAVCLAVCLLLFICCVLPSNFVKNFVLGCVGLSIYPVTIMGIFFSIVFLTKKKYNVKKKYLVYLTTILVLIWFVLHLVLTSKISVENYGVYLVQTYKAKTTAGGLLFGLITYPLIKLLTVVGSYIILGIVLAIFVGLLIDYINKERTLGLTEKKTKFDFNSIENFNIDDSPIETITEEEQTRTIAMRKLGLEKGETTIISSSMPNYDVNLQQEKPLSKKEYILTPLEPVIPPKDIFSDDTNGYTEQRFERRHREAKTNFAEEIKSADEQPKNIVEESNTEVNEPVVNEQPKQEEYNDIILEDDEDLSGYETAFETEISENNDIQELNQETKPVEETTVEEDNEENSYNEQNNEETNEPVEENDKIEEITPDLNEQDYIDEYADIEKDDSALGSNVDTEIVRPSVDLSKFNIPNINKKLNNDIEQVKIEDIKPKEEIPPYVMPPVDLLNYLDNVPRISDEELQDNIDRLEQVLEDFKVPAKVNNVTVGPAVTRYELTMPRGISVNKIAQMSDDIAMTLASNGAIRVEAPIPGKNSVGVEVPNKQISPVSLRELIDSDEFRVRANPLSFVLGRDINGDIIFCNLDKMPHVLVAGSTGSGKSVCLNTMLLSMCYKAGPQDLRLILVDPKMVEFVTYNGLPHLLIPEVITNKDMTINALDWSIKEMERRYAMFSQNHVVNINEFNKLEKVKNKVEEKLPFIVIVVDELADLMLDAKREIEDRIAKLAAKARAAGIHLVLATQRPSVDVITGTVKANLPSRIAFALTNYMDSKTVLDGGGAEKLLGKGDMLFKPQDKPEPRRIQGAYVSNAEISAVVEYIKQNNKPVYDDAAGRAIKNPHQDKPQSGGTGTSDATEFDPVLKDALKWFIQMKQGSGSMISRRYSVGFNRAGRIMDQMERAGFIGPQEGAKPRQVLITIDEYKAIFGDDEN